MKLLEREINYLIKTKKLYVYIYEWIDFYPFNESAINKNIEATKILKNAFLDAGWDGDGILSDIWIPPFAIGSILDEPIDFGYNLIPHWTEGFILWHIKQKEDGLSFIGSLKELELPDAGLEEKVALK